MSMASFDLKSMMLGGVGIKCLEPLIAKALSPLPKLLVDRLKARIAAQAKAGKIDAATLRLLSAWGRAAFKWADDELPDGTDGAEKMDAILNRAATLPILGSLISADRDGARALLQTEFESLRAEAKAEEGPAPVVIVAPVNPVVAPPIAAPAGAPDTPKPSA